MQKILEINNLTVKYKSLKALDGINLDIKKAEILGILGESGAGKSTLALAILKLLPPYAEISGEILFRGENLLNLPEKSIQKIRGKYITAIFQDAIGSLHPLKKIGSQIIEVLKLHQNNTSNLKEKAIELLNSVSFPDPEKRFNDYPHQLSGGMAQKVAIARALACEPEILIADEPTSSIDATAQAEILTLLEKLAREKNLTLIFITHNILAVSAIAERIAVMKDGKIIEINSKEEILQNPKHPYTKKLLSSFYLKQNMNSPCP